MKIAIASDHAGFSYKREIMKHLSAKGYDVHDFGTDSTSAVDYPDFIKPAARSVARGDADAGIVLGGSGNGEAMAANKVRGIRCALCWNTASAKLAKEHNDANMISIGERMVSLDTALQMVDTWLGARFEGGRHIARLQKLEEGS
jgi:ribose 5-phosphate isomerase B